MVTKSGRTAANEKQAAGGLDTWGSFMANVWKPPHTVCNEVRNEREGGSYVCYTARSQRAGTYPIQETPAADLGEAETLELWGKLMANWDSDPRKSAALARGLIGVLWVHGDGFRAGQWW